MRRPLRHAKVNLSTRLDARERWRLRVADLRGFLKDTNIMEMRCRERDAELARDTARV
jgi:hypothetical protein